MNIKKYCLLKNGDIECCYYTNILGEPIKQKPIFMKDGKWFLEYDKWIIVDYETTTEEIIAFADTEEELEAIRNGKGN